MKKPHLNNGDTFAGMAIGLFGGSFNPAHEGHLAMTLYALKQLQLDQVWWLVSPQNPLKSKTAMADFEKRMSSAQDWARHPKIVVTDIESQMGTRYTADTIAELKKRFPKTRFVWLMGADNLRQIPKWHNWETIFNLVPVAVFRRPGYSAGRGLGKAAQRFNKYWLPASEAPKLAKKALKDLPAWVLLDNKLNYISATTIRKENPSWQA